jgi:ribosomal protein L12E/L44/L45/RPP1/RPP2
MRSQRTSAVPSLTTGYLADSTAPNTKRQYQDEEAEEEAEEEEEEEEEEEDTGGLMCAGRPADWLTR